MFTMVSPALVTLVYRDSEGNEHMQPVTDLVDVGTLIDPETGDDMEVYGVLIPKGY